MSNSIKLTEEVSKKMQELKNLACADDSIISQEAKEGLVSVISALEKEITEVSDNKEESNPIPLKETEKDNNHEEINNVQLDWNEPEFSHEKNRKDLKWLISDEINDKNGIPKKGYVKYGMCFKELSIDPEESFSVRNSKKPMYRNLVSIIADNVRNCIDESCYAELRKSDMRLYEDNNLAYSGLFIYKAHGGTSNDSIMNSDGHIDIWVPVETEISQIKSRGFKAHYRTGDFFNFGIYPELRGYILDFESMKNILLNPDNIIYPRPCFHMDGLYDRHSALYRNIKNNNLIYRDENMAYETYDEP